MIDTPAGFEDRVALLVAKKDVSRERTRFSFSTLFGVLSLILLGFAIGWLVRDAADTGFWSYLSLVFSDASDVALNSKEFFLSLLESVPALSLGLVLSASAVLGFASVASARSARRARFTRFNFKPSSVQ